jgi:RNA polymerase sigma-70 factor (ECF subfamily)
MTKLEFEQNVGAAQSSLYRVARSYLCSEHDCLDAVSEAILKAWQKLPSLRNEACFKGWLTRILVRECINIQRQQKRVTPVETVTVYDPPQDADLELMQALDALPQRLRTPTVLYYMEGYRVADIARILHSKKGTISSQLYQARALLRDALKEEDL